MNRTSRSGSGSRYAIWMLPLMFVGVLLLSGFVGGLPLPSSGAPAGAPILPTRLVPTGTLPGASNTSTYTVTFSEHGLPNGTKWDLIFHSGPGIPSDSYNVTSSSVTYALANGSYNYSAVADTAPYSAGTGEVNVSGAAVSVPLSFVQYYWVNFFESGLPSTALWSVTFHGRTITVSGSSITRSFSVPNGTYAYRFGPASGYVPPSSGTVVVAGAAVNVSGRYTGGSSVYNVSFREQGLPAVIRTAGLIPGATWYGMIGLGGGWMDAYGNSTSPLVWSLTNGSYRFLIAPTWPYLPSPASGVVVVNGSMVTSTITFALESWVWFNETGLPSGQFWSVGMNGALNGSESARANTSMVLGVYNGTYRYTIANQSGFVPTPAQGQVTVSGQDVFINVVFRPRTGLTSVNFTETGLSAYYGPWGVTFAGMATNTTGTTLAFAVANGTYAYTVPEIVECRGSSNGNCTSWTNYSAHPANGTVTVSGANQTVPVNFSTTSTVKPTFRITFTETGLSSATYWSIYFGTGSMWGGFSWSVASSIYFSAPNGSYAYRLVPVTGYVAHPPSGTVTVNGTTVTVSVVFSRDSTYAVSFSETGLPNGTSWYVRVNGTWSNPATGSITIWLANGTYAWLAFSHVNASSANSTGNVTTTGNVTVSGGNASVSVTFVVPSPPALVSLRFASTGIGVSASWAVALTAQAGGLKVELAPATTTRVATGGAPIVFRVSPGAYRYTATASGKSSESGTVEVPAKSTPPTITVAFVPSSGGDHGFGLPTAPAGDALAGLALLVIGVLGMTIVGVRSWRTRAADRAAVASIFETEWSLDPEGRPLPRRRE